MTERSSNKEDEDEQFLRQMAKTPMGYRSQESLVEYKLKKHEMERFLKEKNLDFINWIERRASNKEELIHYLKRWIIEMGAEFEAKVWALNYVHHKALVEMIRYFNLVSDEVSDLEGKKAKESRKNHLRLVK